MGWPKEARRRINLFAHTPLGHCLNVCFLILMVALTTFLLIWSFTHRDENRSAAWLTTLETICDISVVAECFLRGLAAGKRYFKKCLSWVDITVAALCIITLVLYEMGNRNAEMLDSDATKMIRAARDVVRVFRIVFFMREFTREYIDLNAREVEDIRDPYSSLDFDADTSSFDPPVRSFSGYSQL
jgi:hypothetical protein